MHTAALSMLETPLQVSHMDNCILYGDVAFVSQWPGIPVGNDEGEFIAKALEDKKALLLAHHGLLIAGTSVEEACVLGLAFERAAKMHLLAAAAGTIQPIDPALGREAHDWILRPKRSAAAFAYYARRALKDARNQDCLATCDQPFRHGDRPFLQGCMGCVRSSSTSPSGRQAAGTALSSAYPAPPSSFGFSFARG